LTKGKGVGKREFCFIAFIILLFVYFILQTQKIATPDLHYFLTCTSYLPI